MKSNLIVLILVICSFSHLTAQNTMDFTAIDADLIQGEYYKVIDTCKRILVSDSLNPETYYKMGIAYQNTMQDDQALNSFYKAATLEPDNRVYNFMLAKGYYGKEKFNLALPLLAKLFSADSMNRVYANYLTGVYMHTGRYDDAIEIYERLLEKDSTNNIYLDKLAFAYLKNNNYSFATSLYNKSLSINDRDMTAIKNLAFLYSETMVTDTAILLLTKGITIDSSDMDLYASRAALNYSLRDFKNALNDYLLLLSSGDSSKLYLKRTGICYSRELQPKQSVCYLLKAYEADSFDYETCSYLGQAYFKLKDMQNSIYYYKREIDILTPISEQLGLTYVLYAESQKANGIYLKAIKSYLKAQNLKPDPNLYMIIANLYDNKLNDKKKAIYYYQKFLDNAKYSKEKISPVYKETVKQRLEFLKMKPLK
jgi:tetratricopeptide (TPR) repeat protein